MFNPEMFLSEFFNFLLASHALPTFTPNIPTFESRLDEKIHEDDSTLSSLNKFDSRSPRV